MLKLIVKSIISFTVLNIFRPLGFVHKSKISKYIADSNARAINRITKEKNREIENLREEMMETHLFEISEKDAVISDLIKEKEEADFRFQNSKLAYYEAQRGIKTNARISSILARNTKRFLEQSGEIYRTFETVKQEAILHKDTMRKRDNKIRKQLGLEN